MPVMLSGILKKTQYTGSEKKQEADNADNTGKLCQGCTGIIDAYRSGLFQ